MRGFVNSARKNQCKTECKIQKTQFKRKIHLTLAVNENIKRRFLSVLGSFNALKSKL